MKLIITRPELAAALAVVKSAAGGSLPILHQVLLAANEASLTLTSTNLDLTLRTKVDAAVKRGAGDRITVRAALLHDIAAAGNGPEVALELIKDALHITCGTAKFKLATMAAEEFPAFTRVKDPVEFVLDDAVLHSLLARTVHAVSTDDSRATLCGTLLAVTKTSVIAVATDGRRLAKAEAVITGGSAATVIIPGRTVKELLRLLNSNPEKPRNVTCSLGTNVASFAWGETTIVTKLIEGKFPSYTQVIPAAEKPICTVGRAELLDALDRVSLVSDAVRLECRKQSLSLISCQGTEAKKDLFGDASDSLLTACQREVNLKLANGYLHDLLKSGSDPELEVFGDANVVLFQSPGWQGVICCLREGDKKEAAKEAPPASDKGDKDKAAKPDKK